MAKFTTNMFIALLAVSSISVVVGQTTDQPEVTTEYGWDSTVDGSDVDDVNGTEFSLYISDSELAVDDDVDARESCNYFSDGKCYSFTCSRTACHICFVTKNIITSLSETVEVDGDLDSTTVQLDEITTEQPELITTEEPESTTTLDGDWVYVLEVEGATIYVDGSDNSTIISDIDLPRVNNYCSTLQPAAYSICCHYGQTCSLCFSV